MSKISKNKKMYLSKPVEINVNEIEWLILGNNTPINFSSVLQNREGKLFILGNKYMRPYTDYELGIDIIAIDAKSDPIFLSVREYEQLLKSEKLKHGIMPNNVYQKLLKERIL